MKTFTLVAVLAAILSGCVVVPAGPGYYGPGYYRYGGPHYYHHYYYRP